MIEDWYLDWNLESGFEDLDLGLGFDIGIRIRHWDWN